MQNVIIQIGMKSRRKRLQINCNLFFFYLPEPVKDSFGTTTVSNLIANSNIFWFHTVFAILYTVFMVIVLRKFSEELEFESHNDSKKTSMMTNVPKNVTSELINQHFR